jgi:hypothetical protein
MGGAVAFYYHVPVFKRRKNSDRPLSSHIAFFLPGQHLLARRALCHSKGMGPELDGRGVASTDFDGRMGLIGPEAWEIHRYQAS